MQLPQPAVASDTKADSASADKFDQSDWQMRDVTRLDSSEQGVNSLMAKAFKSCSCSKHGCVSAGACSCTKRDGNGTGSVCSAKCACFGKCKQTTVNAESKLHFVAIVCTLCLHCDCHGAAHFSQQRNFATQLRAHCMQQKAMKVPWPPGRILADTKSKFDVESVEAFGLRKPQRGNPPHIMSTL